MAKIYEIDQALFVEQEKKTLVTEFAICKDRLLKSYRWLIALADNENIKADTRLGSELRPTSDRCYIKGGAGRTWNYPKTRISGQNIG